MSEVAPGGFVTAGCHSCQLANRADLPPRDRIYADGRWQVAHAFDSALLGWLILFPARHLTSLSELTDDEAAGLGILQQRLSRTLIDAVGCAKTYSILLAEAEGFAHLHFHIVPATLTSPPSSAGPGCSATWAERILSGSPTKTWTLSRADSRPTRPCPTHGLTGEIREGLAVAWSTP